MFATAATTAGFQRPPRVGADEVPIGQQLSREPDHGPVPPDRRVEQPLDGAAGELKWPVGREDQRSGRQEQHQNGTAEVGRVGQAAVDRRPADDRRHRQERQGRRGGEL
jgi:hypothetical protein